MGCKDDAGLRPRCDLLRKDSGRDVQSYSSPGVTERISPAWGVQRVAFVWSIMTEAGMVLMDSGLSRYLVPFHEHIQV